MNYIIQPYRVKSPPHQWDIRVLMCDEQSAWWLQRASLIFLMGMCEYAWAKSGVTSFGNRAVTARFFAVCCRMPIFRHRQIAVRFSWPWTALRTGSAAAWRSPPDVRTVIGRTKMPTASFPGHYPTAIAGGSADGRQGSWRSPGDVHKSVDCRPITVGWSCGHRQVIAQSSSDSHPPPPNMGACIKVGHHASHLPFLQ